MRTRLEPSYPAGMARRADPARIDEARQAATRNRLIGTGPRRGDRRRVDRGVGGAGGPGRPAARRGLLGGGLAWIAEQRAATRGAGGERG